MKLSFSSIHWILPPSASVKFSSHESEQTNLLQLVMERCADPNTQLEIDEAILDYLIYTGIKALLQKSKSVILNNNNGEPHNEVELSLQMVDCRFLPNPQHHFPSHHNSPKPQLSSPCSKPCTQAITEAPSFDSDFGF